MTLRPPAPGRSGSRRARRSPSSPSSTTTSRRDVAVLGGGIVGITTALLLKEAGERVVLLEADRLGRGVTGHTTAKVSSQHGMIYGRLASRFGADAARDLRRRQRGRAALDRRPRARATASTATSAAGPPYAYVTEDRAKAEREARGGDRRRPARLARGRDAAALPGRGRGALRRPGRVPRAQVPARARRAARGRRLPGVRALARRRGRHLRGPDRQDAGRPREGRPRRARHALPVPRPHARLRARAPAALLRARLPDRGRAAGGHVHQRRLADPLGAGGAGRAARSC